MLCVCFLQGCSSQEAVSWQEMMSCDLRWLEVTSFDRRSRVSGCRSKKLAYTVCLTFYKAVAHGRQSRDRKWRYVTSVTGSDPEVTSFERKSPWSGCRRPKTDVCFAFDFLQGCCSQEEAVTWQEITSRELRWAEVTQKWCHLNGSHLEQAVEGLKLAILCIWLHTSLYLAGGSSHVTGIDVMWPQVIGSDLEVTSSDLKSPGSGCSRPKTGVCCAFDFLQGCSSQEEAVTWQKKTSRDLRWKEVTRKWRHLTDSLLEVALEGRKLAYAVHLTSYKAVARRRRQSRYWKWRHVTSFERKCPGSDVILPEVAWKSVEGLKLAYAVRFTTYKAVARRRRQSRDRKWRHVTSGDRKWRHLPVSLVEVAVEGRKQAYAVRLTSYKHVPCRMRRHMTRNDVMWPQVTGSDPEVTSFGRKSPGSGCRRLKTVVCCAFDFLQNCSLQEEAVTCQEMTSRDLRRREVTWKRRHLTGSHLEVALKSWKLAYTVCLTTCKAVAHRRRQSRDSKWRHVTSHDRKWPGNVVIWLEVTWKWL